MQLDLRVQGQTPANFFMYAAGMSWFASSSGEFMTDTFEFDGGRKVTVYMPRASPKAIVFAGDGQRIAEWLLCVENAVVPSTMIVGVHSLTDQRLRLHDYSLGFDPVRFAAPVTFFVEDVCQWTRSRLNVALVVERTAIFGASAGEELALALGLQHPQVTEPSFALLPAAATSRPLLCRHHFPGRILSRYAGTFFLDNARNWAAALHNAGEEGASWVARRRILER